jgi:hypothetical protein
MGGGLITARHEQAFLIGRIDSGRLHIATAKRIIGDRN